MKYHESCPFQPYTVCFSAPFFSLAIKQGNGNSKVPSVLCMLPITIIVIVSVLLCASPSVCSLHLLPLLLESGKSKDLDKPKR